MITKVSVTRFTIVLLFFSICFVLNAQKNSNHYFYDATEMNNSIKFNVVRWSVDYSCSEYDSWFSEKPGLITDSKSWIQGNSEEYGYYTFHRFNRSSYTCNYVRTTETKGGDGYGENTSVSKRDASFSSLKRDGNYYILDLREFKGYVPLYLPFSEEHNKRVWKKGNLIFEWISDGRPVSSLPRDFSSSQSGLLSTSSSKGSSGIPDWVFDYDWRVARGTLSITYHLDRSNSSGKNPFTTKTMIGSDQTDDAGYYTFSNDAFVLKFVTSNSKTTTLKIDYDKKCLVLEGTVPCNRISRTKTSTNSGNTNAPKGFEGTWEIVDRPDLYVDPITLVFSTNTVDIYYEGGKHYSSSWYINDANEAVFDYITGGNETKYVLTRNGEFKWKVLSEARTLCKMRHL